jgi:hypothetical protein
MSNLTPESVFDAANIPPFAHPSVTWADDNPEHPGFEFVGGNDAPSKKGYFILMEAKPGKEELVKAFLHDIHAGVDKEPTTGPWFGIRYSKTTFAIFEAFPDLNARHAHDNGPGGRNFLRSELLKDMLAYPAQLYRIDIMHGKFDTMFGEKVKAV